MRPTWTEAVRGDCRDVVGQLGVETLEPLAGSRVMVVGGTGFVGLWLAELLAMLNLSLIHI